MSNPPPGPGGPDIPTYDEAIASSSRTEHLSSQHNPLLTSSRSTTPEPQPARNGNYRPPRADSIRSSLSSDYLASEYTTPRGSRRGSRDLRREMQELEIEDPLHTPSGGTTSKGLERTQQLAKSILRRLGSFGARVRSGYSAFTPFHGLRHRLGEVCPNPMNAIPENFTNGTYTPLYRLLGIIVVMIIIYIAMASELFVIHRPVPKGEFTRDSVREFVLSEVAGGMKEVRHWEEYVGSFDHAAGTKGDWTGVEWLHQWFNTFRMDAVGVEKYDVWLSFAGEGEVVVTTGERGKGVMSKLELEEVVETGKKGKGKGKVGLTKAYHAFSKEGEVEGHLVYVGRGTEGEYE
ncbi:hypothetical protein BJ508DRAFT_333584, partial [Ascobolus immersus RN42]